MIALKNYPGRHRLRQHCRIRAGVWTRTGAPVSGTSPRLHAVDDLHWRYSLDMSPGLLVESRTISKRPAAHDRASHRRRPRAASRRWRRQRIVPRSCCLDRRVRAKRRHRRDRHRHARTSWGVAPAPRECRRTRRPDGAMPGPDDPPARTRVHHAGRTRVHRQGVTCA